MISKPVWLTKTICGVEEEEEAVKEANSLRGIFVGAKHINSAEKIRRLIGLRLA